MLEEESLEKFIENDIQRVLRTEKSEMAPVNPRIEHAILGIADEAGELVSALKAMIYYDKPIDIVNLKEELGDLWWYFRLFLSELAVIATEERFKNFREEGTISPADIFKEISAMNAAKLSVRYKDGFSEEAARNRDLDGERDAMEKAKN